MNYLERHLSKHDYTACRSIVRTRLDNDDWDTDEMENAVVDYLISRNFYWSIAGKCAREVVRECYTEKYGFYGDVALFENSDGDK